MSQVRPLSCTGMMNLVRSVTAGADIVLMTGPGSFRLIYPRLVAEARRSPTFRRRVHEAAARVLELKRKLRLPAPAG